MTKKKRLGRPAMPDKEKDKMTRLDARVTKVEKEKWKVKAKKEGMTLSDWVKKKLNG